MGNAPPVGGGGDGNVFLSHLVVIDKELIKSSVGEAAGSPVQGVLPEQPEMVTMMTDLFIETILIYFNQTGYRD